MTRFQCPACGAVQDAASVETAGEAQVQCARCGQVLESAVAAAPPPPVVAYAPPGAMPPEPPPAARGPLILTDAAPPVVVPLSPSPPPATDLARVRAALGPPPAYRPISGPPKPLPRLVVLAPRPPAPPDEARGSERNRLTEAIGAPPPYRPLIQTDQVIERRAAPLPEPVAESPAEPTPQETQDRDAVPPTANLARRERSADLPPPGPGRRVAEGPPIWRDVVLGLLVVMLLALGGTVLERRRVMRAYPSTEPIFSALHLTDEPER